MGKEEGTRNSSKENLITLTSWCWVINSASVFFFIERIRECLQRSERRHMELALIFLIYIMWKESNNEHSKTIRFIRRVNNERISKNLQSFDEDEFPDQR